MEFNYRATDERQSGYPLGPGYRGPALSHPNEFVRNPIEMHEMIWWELEKEKIREEIVAQEMARRRILEAEVRREFMIERELAIRSGGDGFLFAPPPNAVRFELMGLRAVPFPYRAEGPSREGMMPMPFEERLGMSEMLRREFGGFDSMPFRRSEPRISEVWRASETSKEKEKNIFLAKPQTDHCGGKRKAETRPVVDTNELPSAAPNKKVRVEWSCAVCQVSATSERGLTEHLQGKKHKANEAGLRKNGKNCSIGLYRKNTAKSYMAADIANNPSSEQGMKIVKEFEKLGSTLFQKEANLKSAKADSIWQPDYSLKNKEATVQRKQKSKECKKKKYTFWCELCKVGAFSEKVMEDHRTGKKHITKLQEANQISRAESSIHVVQANQESSLAGEASQDGKNSVSRNADGIVRWFEMVAHGEEEKYLESDLAGLPSKVAVSENGDGIVGGIELGAHGKEEKFA